jgi:lipid II:glycine glycyltransferase (peptidoglycan interpeptide bridge formation enzyme)
LHGASSNEERNLMAPYLLQWEGIKLAKQLGCKYYDFWGISPAPRAGEASTCFHNLCWSATHRWTGVTRFKAGFGGSVKEYPQAVDVVLSGWKYGVYRLVRKLF